MGTQKSSTVVPVISSVLDHRLQKHDGEFPIPSDFVVSQTIMDALSAVQNGKTGKTTPSSALQYIQHLVKSNIRDSMMNGGVVSEDDLLRDVIKLHQNEGTQHLFIRGDEGYGQAVTDVKERIAQELDSRLAAPMKKYLGGMLVLKRDYMHENNSQLVQLAPGKEGDISSTHGRDEYKLIEKLQKLFVSFLYEIELLYEQACLPGGRYVKEYNVLLCPHHVESVFTTFCLDIFAKENKEADCDTTLFEKYIYDIPVACRGAFAEALGRYAMQKIAEDWKEKCTISLLSAGNDAARMRLDRFFKSDQQYRVVYNSGLEQIWSIDFKSRRPQGMGKDMNDVDAHDMKHLLDQSIDESTKILSLVIPLQLAPRYQHHIFTQEICDKMIETFSRKLLGAVGSNIAF